MCIRSGDCPVCGAKDRLELHDRDICTRCGTTIEAHGHGDACLRWDGTTAEVVAQVEEVRLAA